MAKSARKKPLRQQPAFVKLKELLKQPLLHDLLWHHRAGECVPQGTLLSLESSSAAARQSHPTF